MIRLTDGRVLPEDAVVRLPPFEVGIIIALGLNCADHVKELSKELTVTTQDEPLVFFKGPGALIGHRGCTRRPADVKFMHGGCELAVVIGKTAARVKAATAFEHVAGYTVCNDYAVRDHLENWYRPNLRVKNRDGGTVLGLWFVPAADVPDPHKLALRTLVNGQLTQQGNTADLINTIPALIEYLSSFMTLQAGDVILTGTPDGVVNVNVGDEVVCEIDGIGRLVNTLISDAHFGRRGACPMRIHHLINSKPVESRDDFESVNPATQDVLAEVAAGGAVEINAAVAAAKAVLSKWAGLPATDRVCLLRKLGELITATVSQIARTETQDTGQVIGQTGKQLVPRAADNFT